MHIELKKQKRAKIKITILVLLIMVFSSCQSESVTKSVISYSDNPNWAQIQKEEFVEYKSDFEYVCHEILKNKTELNGWIISYSPVFTDGKIDVWKNNDDVSKPAEENNKLIKQFTKNKAFFESVKTIFYKMGNAIVEFGPYKGQVYSAGGYVDEIYIYNDTIFFSSGLEDRRAVNYIAYTIDGNPPSHGIKEGEELHIKKYAPHWFSVVEGEPRY